MSADESKVVPIGKGPKDLGIQSARIVSAIHQTIERLTIKLQARVKDDKLSGQVLKVRTGRLRRSINYRMDVDAERGPVGTVGTNVVYAKPHELGFNGDQKVREHLRTIKQAWGRPLSEPVTLTVRAHTRHVDIPARSFLQSALLDIQPQLAPELTAAVEKSNASAS